MQNFLYASATAAIVVWSSMSFGLSNCMTTQNGGKSGRGTPTQQFQVLVPVEEIPDVTTVKGCPMQVLVGSLVANLESLAYGGCHYSLPKNDYYDDVRCSK